MNGATYSTDILVYVVWVVGFRDNWKVPRYNNLQSSYTVQYLSIKLHGIYCIIDMFVINRSVGNQISKIRTKKKIKKNNTVSSYLRRKAVHLPVAWLQLPVCQVGLQTPHQQTTSYTARNYGSSIYITNINYDARYAFLAVVFRLTVYYIQYK